MKLDVVQPEDDPQGERQPMATSNRGRGRVREISFRLATVLKRLPDWLWAAVFLTLSLILSALTWDRVRWWTGDSFQYLRMGANLISGAGHTALGGKPEFYFSAGYPAVVGLFDLVLQNPILSGRLVSTFGAAFSMGASYLLFRRWEAKSIALISAWLLLLLPLRIWSSSWVMTEALYMGCVWMALLASSRPRLRWAWIAGLLIGAAHLVRSEGLLYLLPALVILLSRVRGERRRSLQGAALMIGAALLIAIPYLYYGRQQSSTSGLREKLAYNLAWAGAAERGASVDHLLRFDEQSVAVRIEVPGLTLGSLATRVLRNARQAAERLAYHLGPSQLTLPLILLGLLGLALDPLRSPVMGGRLFEQAVVLAPLMAVLLLFVSDRFLLVSAPLVCLWLGKGISEAAWWVSARSDQRRWKPWAAAGFLLIFSAVYFLRQDYPLPASLEPEKTAAGALGEDAAAHNIETPRVMAVETIIPYFADGEWVAPPPADLAATLLLARKANVNYLVVGSQDRSWPAAPQLLAGLDLPAELLPLSTALTDDGIKVFFLSESISSR